MPRQQTQRLSKRPSVETQRGQFGTGITQVVDMPVVAPEKSKGAKLAEAFGMAVKAVGKVYAVETDKKNKRKAIFDSVEGNNQGLAAAQATIEEARDMELSARNQFLQARLSEQMDNLQGSDISDSYLRGYLSAYAGASQKFESENEAEMLKITENNLNTAVINSLRVGFLNNEHHTVSMDKIKTILNVGNAQAGKIYVESKIALIKEEAQNDPNFDWQTAIDNHLKITTGDGVEYATHPTYGKMIDTLESSLTTLTKSRTEQLDKANKKLAVDTTKSILTSLFNTDATPQDIVDAEASILANEGIFTVEQYKSLNKALTTAKESVGFATTSNPVVYAKYQASAIKGELTLNTLEFLKDKVTKDEYKTLASLVLKSDEEAVNIATTTLKESMRDLESSGRNLVAKTDAMGAFLDDNGPAKANMFETEWNRWLVNYTETNQGYPDYETMVKAQQDIVNRTNMLFEDTDETGIQDVLEYGTVEDVQKALKFKAIKQQDVADYKTEVLTNGTVEQLQDAFDRGILTATDFVAPKPAAPKPAAPVVEEPGFFDRLFGLQALEDFEEGSLEQLQQSAKDKLGEETYKAISDFINEEKK